jgi:hypothetical protein
MWSNCMSTRTVLAGATLLALGALLCWLSVSVRFAPDVHAQQKGNAPEPGKLTPLPDKLPPSVEARVGKVEFTKGLPTQKGIEQLFEIQDFQRATQLYQWAIPAIGAMGWHRASIANGKTQAADRLGRWAILVSTAVLVGCILLILIFLVRDSRHP